MALLAFLAGLLGQAQARVIISEFLAVNDKGLVSAGGERSDWIEIHNAGDATIDLAGWTLTDDAENLAKWTFPAVKIEAGGYLLVFASGADRVRPDRELHANFKLGASGEYLGLVQPGGRAVAHHFVMKYPKQRDDISYGIPAGWQPDPTSKASVIAGPVYFLRPTPGAPNGQTLAGKVVKLTFSQPHGFHGEPFELMITSQTPGAVVRYTTDGSVPTIDSGRVLDGALTVAQTTVIRAAAFKPGHKPTKVVTQTYLFLEDVVRQSYDGLPPAGFHYEWGSNRVDYGMDQRVVNDERYRDKIFEGMKVIPSYSLVMDLEDLFGEQDGIYANAKEDGRGWERPCSLELIQGDDQEGFQENCGVRIRGGFSRMTSNAKHAFRFFFRSEYGPAKLKYPVFGKAAAREFDNL
ncbi:MAG: lamin tail domain-containing protein, partial [Verrucomicrobiota bacterium]|nr:lamin tail domain-containing protein [Verrucomicrobiota bacterium]